MYRNCYHDEDPFVDPSPLERPTRSEAEQDAYWDRVHAQREREQEAAAYRAKSERDAQLARQRTHVAASPVQQATDRQINFMRILVDERQLEAAHVAWIEDQISLGLDKSKASRIIERLKQLPKRTQTVMTDPQYKPSGQRVTVEYYDIDVDGGKKRTVGYLFGVGDKPVPAGHYALKQDPDMHNGNDVAFYRLWVGQRYGWQLKLCHGPDETPISKASAISILGVISDNLEDSLALYGHRIGRCGICSRRLTNAGSRQRGIGPVCYANMMDRLF